MNWGYKIAIVYSIFVVLILAMVYKSSTQNIDLVTEEYYAEELKHQQKIDKQKNTAGLESPVLVSKEKDFIQINFPDNFSRDDITGIIHFYKPDDKEKDKFLELAIDDNRIQKVDISTFSTGYYQIKLEWKANGLEYYQEENIFL